MSKTLMLLLLPLLNFKLSFGDGDAAPVEATTTETVAPEVTDTPTDEPAKEEAAPKTYTEEELKAKVDAEAAKTRARYERKLERARIEQETREKVVQELRVKEPAAGKPSVDQYADYESYLEDLADWKAEEKYKAIENEKAQKDAQARQQSESQRLNERKATLMEAGEAEYADFEEVITSNNVKISEPAYLAIVESEIAHKLAYHLATNPEEAEKLAQLPPYAQAKEIGKLEDRLSAPAKKQISKAPAPISPVTSGKASNDSVLSDDLPIDEWMKRRNKEVRGR